MKRLIRLLIGLMLLGLLSGCAESGSNAQVAATTLPVYDFTLRLCQGTPITVTRLVTEQVSCLHDYSLNVRQVRAVEKAEMVVISGAGLEEFLGDLLLDAPIVDASQGITLLCPEEDQEGHDHDDGHHHEEDPTSGCPRRMQSEWRRISAQGFLNNIRSMLRPLPRI